LTDELDLLVAQGRAERAAANAERHTPEGKAKRNRGRAQRNRGYRTEHRLAKRLARFGFERVPLSGAAGGSWSGDLRRTTEDHRYLTYLECKHREDAMITLDKWLQQSDRTRGLLIDRGAAKEPLFVAYLKDVERLLEEGGYEVREESER
jgi:hypothetical protein